MGDGKIKQRFSAHCGGKRCTVREEGYSANSASFGLHHLDKHGWRRINGRWYCPRCAKDPKRQR